MLIALLACTLALAADRDLLVIDGDEATAKATAQTLFGAADREIVPFAALLAARPPVLVGQGTIALCSGAALDASSLAARLEQIEKAASYLDYEQANHLLDSAEADLPCARERIPPELVGRMSYLRGFIAYESGQPDRARAAFAAAVVAWPQQGWDPDHAPDGQPLFEATKAETLAAPKQNLEILPYPLPGGLSVDGVAVEARQTAVYAGTHLLQAGEGGLVTLQVRLDPQAEARLVLPGAVTGTLTSWMSDAERQAQLGLVLAAIQPAGRRVLACADYRCWSLTVGSTEWKTHIRPIEDPRTGSERVHRPVTRLVIAGALVVGALLLALLLPGAGDQ